METIEHQEVKFSGRPVDEIFALPSPEPGVFFPSDSFLARALAAIPRTGSMVFEDEGPCTQACVTSKAGFEPLHVTRIMVDGQKKYVWCLGESPIFPRSSYTVSVTRSESDRPLMSIGKQVAVLINALNYHLVNFYLRERSSVPGFDPATFRLPVWAQWCAICKASPVAGPLLPRNPAPNQGSADRVIDVEDLRDIAIHSELYDIRKIVNAHKRTYLMTGRWRRSDIREIHEASCPSPVDYRNASGHVIQISQPLHSRSPAQADPFDVDGLGLSSFKERQRRAIGRAIRRVRDVRMVTGRLNSALVTLSELHTLPMGTNLHRMLTLRTCDCEMFSLGLAQLLKRASSTSSYIRVMAERSCRIRPSMLWRSR